MTQGYRQYAQQLLAERQLGQLPPFRHMALIRAESTHADQAEKFLRMARQLAELINPPSPDLSYLGPLPAMMEKRAGRFRYVLQLDANQRTHLQQLVTQLALQLENHPDGRGLRWSIDIDPQEL